jgi:hypothetical protein
VEGKKIIFKVKRLVTTNLETTQFFQLFKSQEIQKNFSPLKK